MDAVGALVTLRVFLALVGEHAGVVGQRVEGVVLAGKVRRKAADVSEGLLVAQLQIEEACRYLRGRPLQGLGGTCGVRPSR